MFFSGETGTQGKQYLCASYVRLSQDDGDKEESNSIVNQKNLIFPHWKNHFVCMFQGLPEFHLKRRSGQWVLLGELLLQKTHHWIAENIYEVF